MKQDFGAEHRKEFLQRYKEENESPLSIWEGIGWIIALGILSAMLTWGAWFIGGIL